MAFTSSSGLYTGITQGEKCQLVILWCDMWMDVILGKAWNVSPHENNSFTQETQKITNICQINRLCLLHHHIFKVFFFLLNMNKQDTEQKEFRKAALCVWAEAILLSWLWSPMNSSRTWRMSWPWTYCNVFLKDAHRMLFVLSMSIWYWCTNLVII